MTRCHDEAYENLTRGLNNADKRRLAEILEERASALPTVPMPSRPTWMGFMTEI